MDEIMATGSGAPGALEFFRIYELYYGKVLAYATKLIGPDDAADVAQEVFIKIGRSLDTLADPSRLASWIYAVTLNTVRDAARARAARASHLAEGPPVEQDGGDGDALLSEAPDLKARSPEEVAVWNEMLACYLDHVKQLPHDYLEVYVLSELMQLTNAEIAERLSTSVGTVKIRLHRARTRLHEQLRRHCHCYYNDRGDLMGAPN